MAFRPSSLGIKIFGLAAVAIVLALGTALLLVRRVARVAADDSIDRALGAAQAAIDDKLAARSGTLRATTERLAQVPTYSAAVEEALDSGDRGTLLDATEELERQLGADWVLIVDRSGVLAAWSDHPDRAGIDLAGGALVDLALGGAVTEGIWLEPGPRSELVYQAVAVPLRGPGRSAPFGAVIAALPVDSALAASLARNTGSEIVIFTRDSAWAPVPIVATRPVTAGLVASLGTDTAATRVTMADSAGEWIGTIGALRTAGGAPIAGVVGLRSRSAELAPYLRLQRVITGSLVGGLVLALVASAWITRRITRPVLGLVNATRRVGEGDYSVPVRVDSNDEIGELARAFRGMVHDLGEKQRLVEYLSGGRPVTPAPAAVPPPGEAAPVEVGTVLANRYRLEQLLGAGGMGVVYRAVDRELGETVALKVLNPNLRLADPVFLDRFKQELRLARRITHRNVVRTHDLGESAGIYFITMELVEGTPLDQLLKRRGTLPVDVTIPITKQLLRALDAAHEVGVIHRDVKPGNLMVQPSGLVKVMDFGIARLVEGAASAGGGALTQAGVLVGSPDYMAPEQLLGEPIDHRVDLYAVGALMFECLVGRRVYQATNVMMLISRHLEEPVPDPAALGPIPPSLAAVIRAALAKDPARRFESAAAMLQAIEAAS